MLGLNLQKAAYQATHWQIWSVFGPSNFNKTSLIDVIPQTFEVGFFYKEVMIISILFYVTLHDEPNLCISSYIYELILVSVKYISCGYSETTTVNRKPNGPLFNGM